MALRNLRWGVMSVSKPVPVRPDPATPEDRAPLAALSEADRIRLLLAPLVALEAQSRMLDLPTISRPLGRALAAAEEALTGAPPAQGGP